MKCLKAQKSWNSRVRNASGYSILPLDGFFLAIGRTPNTDLVRGKLDIDEAGYIRTQAPTTATSVAGVFAAGDVADSIYQQAINAAASGCRAAMDADRFLIDG